MPLFNFEGRLTFPFNLLMEITYGNNRISNHWGISGLLAGNFMKGAGFGLLGNIVVGIVGAFIGGFVLGLVGVDFGGFIGSLVTATIGAFILLFIVSKVKK